ncbi:hypothetical protein HYQ45_000465 [Verticillium longisporum]|uniref:Uncharacterized protein n=1 Tax=Verticillium longisporum TaxID=100787 RepID=A0A8I3A492_VERLO|nr:hypothetical protein HYQ45_000465 [Verticillium longisporum]
MSWKLTKKLKETHLGPLASTFSRSPSTSTIVEGEKGQPSASAGAAAPATPSPLSNSDTIAASESMAQAPVVTPPKPGILVVTLHEGQGFSLPEQHRATFNSSHPQNSLSTGNALSGVGSRL